MTNIQQTKNLLKKININPSKQKGQNFLVEHTYLDVMIKAANINQQDLVIEIGPGLGVLTEALSKNAKRVLAIELDEQIIEYLQAGFLKEHKNVDLIRGDVLSSTIFHNYTKWLAKQCEVNAVNPTDQTYAEFLASLNHKYKVVANLPYQITSKIFRQFLGTDPKPSLMVLMVQKEVAQRITAHLGETSLLSLSVQAYGKVNIVDIVPANAFFPVPKVDSAIVCCNLEKGDDDYGNLSDQEKTIFWKLAKIGFSSRRKQLKNNLVHFNQQYFKEYIGNLFKKLNFSDNIRAQELSIRQWCDLTKEINNNNKRL